MGLGSLETKQGEKDWKIGKWDVGRAWRRMGSIGEPDSCALLVAIIPVENMRRGPVSDGLEMETLGKPREAKVMEQEGIRYLPLVLPARVAQVWLSRMDILECEKQNGGTGLARNDRRLLIMSWCRLE